MGSFKYRYSDCNQNKENVSSLLRKHMMLFRSRNKYPSFYGHHSSVVSGFILKAFSCRRNGTHHRRNLHDRVLAPVFNLHMQLQSACYKQIGTLYSYFQHCIVPIKKIISKGNFFINIYLYV